eukprot:scaffold164460_cov10-Tisochrysis_lutea.AAC.1
MFLYKLGSHAGIAGNGCADAIAKHKVSLDDTGVADTGAGPGGNHFQVFGLSKEETRKRTTS